MKIRVIVEKNDNNIMEFDGDKSELTQEEIVRNIHAVAEEWIKRFDESRDLNSSKT